MSLRPRVSRWLRRLSRLHPARDRAMPRPVARSPFLELLEDRMLMSLTVTIDYSLDTNGFFNTQAKKDALASAAAHVASFLNDSLDAIVPGGGNAWNATFTHPGTGASGHSVANLTVAQNEVVVYAGGRNLGPSGGGFVLGVGGPGGFNTPPSTAAWNNTVRSRGEAGALLTTPTDFGPWGGAVTFTTNAGVTFNYGPPTQPLGVGETSFFAVAVHEITHLFGFGTAPSWTTFRDIGNAEFFGAAAQAEYDLGGPVPLDGGLGHWANGTTESGQPVIMSATLNANSRFLTALDVAALDDIGWEIVTAPFTEVNTGLPGVEAAGVDWGDFDNDGDLDLALKGSIGQNNTLTRIYRNDSGSFIDLGALVPQTEWRAIDWGDYDNDGDLDLLHMGWDGGGPQTRLLRNDGGVFNPVASTPFGSGTERDSEWLDFDNDGDLDLLLSGSDGVARLFRNNGNDSFVAAQDLQGLQHAAIAAGDYDDDGDIDLVMAGTGAGSFQTRLYRNDGGTFVSIVSPFMNASWAGLEWGDYDADGDLDLAIAGRTSSGGEFHTKIYRNNGGGSFTDIGAGLLPVERATLGWADYDNDGDLDLVVAGLSSGGRATRLYTNNNGTFIDSNVLLTGVDTTDLAWGDYDGDGDVDLLLAGMSDGGRVTKLYRNESTVANTAPSAPVNLSDDVTNGVATLTWAAGTDPQTPATGLGYNIRIGTTPGGNDIVSGMADAVTGTRHTADLGNAQESLTWKIKTLPKGTYFWSVQSIDGAFAGSNWAAENQFTIVNTLPVAVDNVYTISGSGTTNVDAFNGVLTNDTDANNDPMTAVLVDNVDHGSLTLNPNGSFSYTPGGTFTGSDTFTYRANDGEGNSNIAPVTLSIPLTLSVADVSVAEGATGFTNLTFTVTLTTSTAQTVTVNYATANGTASAPGDYLAASGLLTFTPGQTSKTVVVSVVGDQTVELNETVVLNLSNATNASIADGQAIGTISNDDSAVVTINDASQAEGNASNAPMAFTVTLSNPVDTTVTLMASTANGTATVAGNDYNPVTNQVVTFTPGGSLTQMVNVGIVGDTAIESDETLIVGLADLITGGRSITFADPSGLGTITDDDQPIVVSLVMNSVTLHSDASGVVTGFFDLTFAVPPVVMDSVAAYNVQLSIAPLGSITFTGAAEADNALFPGQTPRVFQSGNTLFIGDDLDDGESLVSDGSGLARVLFQVQPGIEGVFDVTITFAALFDGESEDVASTTVNGQIVVVADSTPPVVENVQVDGTGWNALFPLADGHTIPTGADQFKTLPWFNTNQVRIAFSEHVEVQQEDLFVRGVNVQDYSVASFEYDESTFTATWTLAAAFNVDKVLIGFSRPIEDQFGNVLDGDWTNGGDSYPSGDGSAGGDFLFRFNVLPGNADQTGAVQGNDVILVRNAQFQLPGAAGYNPMHDVNATGNILGNDVILVRNRQFTTLPGGEPTPPMQPLLGAAESSASMVSAAAMPVDDAALRGALVALATASISGAAPARHGVPWSPKWIAIHEAPSFFEARFNGHAGSLVSDLVELKPVKSKARGHIRP